MQEGGGKNGNPGEDGEGMDEERGKDLASQGVRETEQLPQDSVSVARTVLCAGWTLPLCEQLPLASPPDR